MIRATRLALLAATLTLGAGAVWADKLDDVKKAGVLRAAAFDANPPFGYVNPKTRKIVGLDVDYANELAKKLGVKLAWGTDFLFEPGLNVEQNTFILALREWFTPAEILKMVTHDNAELLALSGLRSPYAGRLGVVEEGALADLLLVDGDPLANLQLLADADRNFRVIMKDGKIYKNSLEGK